MTRKNTPKMNYFNSSLAHEDIKTCPNWIFLKLFSIATYYKLKIFSIMYISNVILSSLLQIHNDKTTISSAISYGLSASVLFRISLLYRLH